MVLPREKHLRISALAQCVASNVLMEGSGYCGDEAIKGDSFLKTICALRERQHHFPAYGTFPQAFLCIVPSW